MELSCESYPVSCISTCPLNSLSDTVIITSDAADADKYNYCLEFICYNSKSIPKAQYISPILNYTDGGNHLYDLNIFSISSENIFIAEFMISSRIFLSSSSRCRTSVNTLGVSLRSFSSTHSEPCDIKICHKSLDLIAFRITIYMSLLFPREWRSMLLKFKYHSQTGFLEAYRSYSLAQNNSLSDTVIITSDARSSLINRPLS